MAKTRAPAPDCSYLLRVLADQTRLAVVRHLMRGPRTVGQIMSQLGVEQSLLSHHLQALRAAGLVIAEREGKSVRYRLADDAVRESGDAISLGCCDIHFGPETTRGAK